MPLHRLRTGIFVLALGLFVGTLEERTANAQVAEAALGFATSVLGKITVDKIFKSVNQAIDQAQKEFESSGNRLLGSGVDQARQLLKQLGDILSSEREKTFIELSDQRKLALWDLYSVSQKLKEGVFDDIAKDTVQLDKLIANINFIGHDVKFLIVRVMPTVFQQNYITNNPIRVFGVGFGTDQADKKFKTVVKVGDVYIPEEKISIKEWGLEVFLEKSDFAQNWKTDEFALVPMKIESAITSRGSWWCAWAGCQATEKFAATYHIDLYPTAAAQLRVTQRGEEEVPTGEEAWVKVSTTTPNMDGQDHDATTTGGLVSAGDGWKWDHYDPSQAHDGCIILSGNGCPFTTNHHCDFSVDHSQVQCTLNNSGHSVIWQFGVLKKRYHFVRTTLPSIDVSISPGESKVVEILAGAKSAWLEGVLPIGQKFGPVSLVPPSGNALDPVSCTGGQVLGDKRAFTCVMREPI